MTAVDANRSYYPALDGLRGVAILLVVFYHNFGFIQQSYFGWLGVDLFFVLSGFLITNILIKHHSSTHYLKNFFARRALRIFPLYFLCLVIFLILFPFLNLYERELNYFVKNQVWLWTYTQNWLYSFYLSGNAQMLTHLWSLAVEEQFYLIWPFVILLVKKTQRLFIIMGIVLLSVMSIRCLIWHYQIEDLNYTTLYTFTRIDGICIGSLIALVNSFKPGFLSRNMWVIVTGLAAMNFVFYFVNNITDKDFPYLAFIGYTTFAVMFGLLVNEIAGGNDHLITRLFNFAPLRFTGKISYGFYMLHWPIYLMTRPYIYEYLNDELHLSTTISRLGTSLTATALGFMLSIVSYYAYEQHFLKLKKRFT